MVAFNVLTFIVYLKERSLRKPSMYLVMNQAVADMFVGVNVLIACWLWGTVCELWTINLFSRNELTFLILVLWTVSHLASLINLGAISLERTHATFRPFKHRLIKKKIFGAAVAIVWIAAGAISTGIASEQVFEPSFSKRLPIFYISYVSSSLFCLLTIIVSYSSMAIKIVYGIQPPRNSATNRERKFTKTLFVVTAVSLLLTLPFIIVDLCEILRLGTSIPFHFRHFFYFIFCANSLINPVLYTVRMPEFKRALFSLLPCRSQSQLSASVFPLNEM